MGELIGVVRIASFEDPLTRCLLRGAYPDHADFDVIAHSQPRAIEQFALAHFA
jgi:hypothetical protein